MAPPFDFPKGVAWPIFTFVNEVDTETKLQEALSHLVNVPEETYPYGTDLPQVYFDVEGVNLGRNGTVSLLQMYVVPARHVYLFDIYMLGSKAFTTPEAKTGMTLHSFLESPTRRKVFFDVRTDSDALYAHFKIKLAGIRDLQLYEYITVMRHSSRVSSLANCCNWDAYLEWRQTDMFWNSKKKGKKLFTSGSGSGYAVFEERPLNPTVLKYSIQDVLLLPVLYERYNHCPNLEWRIKIEEETQKRLEWSRDPDFRQGGHLAYAPSWFGENKSGIAAAPADPSETQKELIRIWDTYVAWGEVATLKEIPVLKAKLEAEEERKRIKDEEHHRRDVEWIKEHGWNDIPNWD
jgi:exonuclease 3'-5' domain-containing protein 1